MDRPDASHGLDAILLGTAWDSIAHGSLPLDSTFPRALGAIFLAGSPPLASRCCFNVPRIGIAPSLILYLAGMGIALA